MLLFPIKTQMKSWPSEGNDSLALIYTRAKFHSGMCRCSLYCYTRNLNFCIFGGFDGFIAGDYTKAK